jgi:LAS superfamily LD-carboxypeptidase LdcB
VIAVLLVAVSFCAQSRGAVDKDAEPTWTSATFFSTGFLAFTVLQQQGLASDLLSALYYYDESRLQRYQEFQALHPEYSGDTVVWMVGCDLDLPAYAQGIQASDPANLYVLVNKQHCLPDWYAPGDLVTVGNAPVREFLVAPLEELLAAAAAAGVSIYPSSGFRSFQTQELLWNSLAATSGETIADGCIARAGFSEHQTGLVLDINTADYQVYGTPEDFWLEEHAWEYGFIVRYTNANSDITQYVAEPWHLRYVGKEVAQLMHDGQIGSFEEYYLKYVLYAPPAD